MRKSILVVDKNMDDCRRVAHILEDPLTEVLSALSTDEAVKLYTRHRFCLVIIDGLLAEQNKVELLKVLRNTRVVPILALLPSITPEQRTLFLHGGAAAVLEKGCGDNELLAQVESLVSLYMALNPEEGQSYTLAYGMDFIIDYMRHQVILDGEPVDLPRKEFEVLYELARHPNQVLSAEQIYANVWPNESSYNADASIKNHIMKIRKKLALHGKACIRNVWGVGYYFSDPLEQQKRKNTSRLAEPVLVSQLL